MPETALAWVNGVLLLGIAVWLIALALIGLCGVGIWALVQRRRPLAWEVVDWPEGEVTPPTSHAAETPPRPQVRRLVRPIEPAPWDGDASSRPARGVSFPADWDLVWPPPPPKPVPLPDEEGMP